MASRLPCGMAVFGVIALFVAFETQANFLFGRWERERPNAGWISFQWLEFTDRAIRSDVFPEISIDRYDITNDLARVYTRFGAVYVFELVDTNRICLPAAKVQALTDSRSSGNQHHQLCYMRA